MAYRRRTDKAYDLACLALAAESPVMPPDSVIEERAAQYRIWLEAEYAPDAETQGLDLKDVEATVAKQVATKKQQGPRGLPRPKEVLRRGNH